ncbi:cupin domain protein [Metarhizium robertsii]|uniref:Cupin type-2 domain-containing protein n=2 Tax=Metarhizium TaxID=5529 RepID=A0A0D9P5A0_METAN|nr:cupin domain protein [Metarhizium robertsii]KJK81308.1 hypothetical protein H634G_03327 [Metarhizium anisopliae BRIP 53293]
MSTHVHITRASELDAGIGQTEGMIRKGAIIGKSDRICSLVMTAKPHTSSVIHHHGDQDTIIFASSGHGSLVLEGGSKRQDLAPGDFAFIPAGTEHQEVNDSDEEVTWVVMRTGKTPATVNLEGWQQKA